MAIKIQKYSYLRCRSERVEVPDDLEEEIDNNSNNKKLITKNIIIISFFATIGILIAIYIITNLKYNKPSDRILAKEFEFKYISRKNIIQKIPDELDITNYNDISFIQRKTCGGYFVYDNETGEFKLEKNCF